MATMRQRGFTLVELLVALSVMALLAILSWRGLDGMVRAQAATEERADQVLALQTGLAQWGADLDALVQQGALPALEWNGRVLRMLRRGTASVTDGVRVVAWGRRDGLWLRWQSGPLTTRGQVEAAWQEADTWSQTPTASLRRFEVPVVPLEEWQVFYYRDDAWTNPLSSAASSTSAVPQQEGSGTQAATSRAPIPQGVRLVLVLPPGQAVAGRLTRDWVGPTVAGGKS